LILLAVAVVPVAYWSFSTSADADPPRAINLTGRIPETVFLNPKAVPKRSVKEWRKIYPFRSIRSRLTYVTRATTPMTKPKLNPASVKRLAEDEMMIIGFFDVRKRSLEMMHSAKAEEFVKRSGFGIGRLRIPASPSRLPEPDAPPLQLVTTPPLAPSVRSAETVQLPVGKAQIYADPQRMPDQRGLLNFHRSGHRSFLVPARYGYIKDIDHVSGFASHKFIQEPKVEYHFNPERKDNVPKENWLLKRLELVSLLKHDKPVAYVSGHLPDLEKLDEIKTRPLVRFESRGLEKLYDGEDLMIEARLNTIHMLGSLRASKQCLQYHKVQRGELLGAFSYELQRDPVIAEPVGTRVSGR
jgi:hypothetical protein